MSQLKIKDGNNWVNIPAGGIGVPSGGTAGQVLKKSSSTDYATEWATPQTIKYIDITKTTDNNGFVAIAPSELPSNIQVLGVFIITPFPSSGVGSVFVSRSGAQYSTSDVSTLTSYAFQVTSWNGTGFSNTSVHLRLFYYE